MLTGIKVYPYHIESYPILDYLPVSTLISEYDIVLAKPSLMDKNSVNALQFSYAIGDVLGVSKRFDTHQAAFEYLQTVYLQMVRAQARRLLNSVSVSVRIFGLVIKDLPVKDSELDAFISGGLQINLIPYQSDMSIPSIQSFLSKF